MIPPGLQSTPGAFYTLPPPADAPPLKRPGVCQRGAGASGLHKSVRAFPH
nr:MAG TPA: hypothetical protein [Caudoviricetes sp.]